MKPKQNYKPGPMDNCQTPDYALTPLLDFLPPGRLIWESAAGEGWLVRALRKNHFSVFATELDNGIDFFKQTDPLGDLQVTNPPYGLKFKWIEHSYDLMIPFALLLPVETLGSTQAQALFKKCGIEVLLLDSRVDFKMPNKGWKGQAQFPVAWFCSGLRLGSSIRYGHIDQTAKRRWKKDHERLL